MDFPARYRVDFPTTPLHYKSFIGFEHTQTKIVTHTIKE